MKVDAIEHPFSLLKRQLGCSAVVGRGRSVRATLFPSLSLPSLPSITSHHMPQNPPVSHSAQIAGVWGYDESREREGGKGGADNNETYSPPICSPPALFSVQTHGRTS